MVPSSIQDYGCLYRSELQKYRVLMHGIMVETSMDFLPLFVEAGKTKRLYLLRDTHWNEDSNALAAEILFDAVNKNISQ